MEEKMERLNKIVFGMLTVIITALCMSACSFKVEFGYHGETGRDDRTQSQLIKPIKVQQDKN